MGLFGNLYLIFNLVARFNENNPNEDYLTKLGTFKLIKDEVSKKLNINNDKLDQLIANQAEHVLDKNIGNFNQEFDNVLVHEFNILVRMYLRSLNHDAIKNSNKKQVLEFPKNHEYFDFLDDMIIFWKKCNFAFESNLNLESLISYQAILTQIETIMFIFKDAVVHLKNQYLDDITKKQNTENIFGFVSPKCRRKMCFETYKGKKPCSQRWEDAKIIISEINFEEVEELFNKIPNLI